MNIKKSQAFSLIELSIVIVIIGVLVSAVVKSSDILYQVRLKMARSTTSNSPLNSIDGLYSWYETTSSESLDFASGQQIDGAKISSWNDVSSNSVIFKVRSNKVSEINLTQSNSALQPIYIEKSINNLPAIRFNRAVGIGDYLYSGSYNINTDQFSFFMVTKKNGDGWEVGVLSGVSNSTRYDYSDPSAFWIYEPGQVSTTDNFMTRGIAGAITNPGVGVPYIMSFVYNGSVAKTYMNGIKVDEDTASGTISIQKLFIAKRNYTGSPGAASSGAYQGDIAEIIFFTEALTDNNRLIIEKYLGQKYGIKIKN